MRQKMRTEENAEEIFLCMEKIQKYVGNSCDKFEAKGILRYLQISDGFIIVADLDMLNEFCDILCRVQWNVLIHSQMMIRGAITAGNVSMSDDSRLIIGPGFIDAFVLESENAIFPRVLFSPDINKYVDLKNKTPKYVKKDSDNFMYLDFLQYAIDIDKIGHRSLLHLMQTQGVIKFVEDGYINHLENKKNVAQKYGWMISKLGDKGIQIKTHSRVQS
jgi:hypothetical protein